MLNIFILFILNFFIVFVMMKISMLISFKKLFDLKKNISFECGFDPMSSARISFSLQFYVIMIIFLIFDIELIILIPMLKTFQISNIIIWLLTSMILILILLMGIYFEWIQGMLNWSF